MSSISFSSANNNPAAAVISVIPSPTASNPTAVEIQKINALYTNLKDDNSAEYALYHDVMLDKKLIADTPLHSAAAAGETLLAMEIITLKPSFAWKLNGAGLSPMHLALVNGHIETVRLLLTIDPRLVRVKGKYRMTLLHYAAEMVDENEILAEFLLYCPSAIKDLNSRCQSALHIAVKCGNIGACKVMLGWLQKKRKSDLYRVLNWKDADGNNVLHIAVSTNQREVLRLLAPHINVLTRNLQGKSCVDLADQHDEEVMKILLHGRHETLDQIKYIKELSHAEHLSSCSAKMTVREFFVHSINIFGKEGLPMETRNAYLVVTGLILTVTYQAMLSPPGGYRLDTTTTVAFFVSSYFMIFLVLPLPGSWILIFPSLILMASYLLEAGEYNHTNPYYDKFVFVGITFFFLLLPQFLLIGAVHAKHAIARKSGPISPRGYIRR